MINNRYAYAVFFAQRRRLMGFAAVMIATAAMLSPAGAAASGIPISTSSVQSVDPNVKAKAREWYHRFQMGNIDRSQLSRECNRGLTSQFALREMSLLKPLGKPIDFVFMNAEPVGGAMGYNFIVLLPRGRVVESIAFEPSGKIAGINFQTFVRDGSGN
jgi:hypothetical protein